MSVLFFASDIHLGYHTDRAMEKRHRDRFLRWLDLVEREQNARLYLLGDLFDFWFEYPRSIPSGHEEVLAKLREMSRQGIEIHFFKGNHDMWTRGYLSQEVGITIHNGNKRIEADGKSLWLGHGDTLPLERSPLAWCRKKIFHSKFLFDVAATLIPHKMITAFGKWWSRNSRQHKEIEHPFRNEREPIAAYIEQNGWQADYFVFGHIHAPATYPLKKKAGTLVVLGQWIEGAPLYAEMRNGVLALKEFEG